MERAVPEVALEGWVDASAVLRAGVYALVKNGVVIYVGKSKTLYQRIYAHRHTARNASRGKKIPDWLPTKGFVFDQVFVRPCALEALDALEAEMIERYKPRYNQSLKTAAKVKASFELKIGNVAIPFGAMVAKAEPDPDKPRLRRL